MMRRSHKNPPFFLDKMCLATLGKSTIEKTYSNNSRINNSNINEVKITTTTRSVRSTTIATTIKIAITTKI
jgi:hypothetical protein